MSKEDAMRFMWMPAHEYLPTVEHPHFVLDTQPPNGEPGEVVRFSVCPTKAQAVMTCMALNGNVEADPGPR